MALPAARSGVTPVTRHLIQGALPQRVIVVRALQGLGDLLCATPAWRALRAALPHAHLALVGLATARSLVARIAPYFDEFLPFPGYPGIPEHPFDPEVLAAFLEPLQRPRFDVALQMHGSGPASNAFTTRLKARRMAGFYRPGHFCPDPQGFLPYLPHESEVRRYLRLLAWTGIPPQGEALDFALYPEDRDALSSLVGAAGLVPSRSICLHPGAWDAARRWPVAHFAALGDALTARGWQVVLTGSAEEQSLTGAVAAAMHVPPLDLAGQTTLGMLGALLRDARALVCNDTGVSHLAAALGTPSIVLFLASDPRRWAPLDRTRHRAVGEGSAASTLPTLPPSVPQVLDEVEALLAHEDAYVS